VLFATHFVHWFSLADSRKSGEHVRMTTKKNKIPEDVFHFLEFLKDMSRLLIECGCSSNRVEALCTQLGKSWGFDIDVLAIPTGVWIVARHDNQIYYELTRVKSWKVDLKRLSELNDLVESIYAKKVSTVEARLYLDSISRSKPPYPTWLAHLAGGGSSAGLIAYYNGTWTEVGAAGFIGLVLHFMNQSISDKEHRRHLSDFLSGVIVTFLAMVISHTFPGIDEPRLIVAGLISQVPGLVFVNAIHEIAQKNLVSGTAKLTDAMVVAASLTFGVVSTKGLETFLRWTV
jgi:uncharacterized membrane protein YjjP (DUF1212 family)